MSEPHFMDELLAEVEEHENLQSEALCDLVLIEISGLEDKIAQTFATAEEEQTFIQNFALRRATKFSDRIQVLSKKLESFIRDSGEKTKTLPHGVLKIRKRQDKVEVVDMEQFLLHARKEMLNTVPESAKPDISGIKSWIKMTGGKIPPGVRIIEGTETFSYKLTETNDNGTDTDTEEEA